MLTWTAGSWLTSCCLEESSPAPGPQARKEVRELVPLAVMFRDLAGGSTEALSWTDSIAAHGVGAFSRLGLHGDIVLLLADKIRAVGILASNGKVDRVRLAELVVVLDIIGRVPPPAAHTDANSPLVF